MKIGHIKIHNNDKYCIYREKDTLYVSSNLVIKEQEDMIHAYNKSKLKSDFSLRLLLYTFYLNRTLKPSYCVLRSKNPVRHRMETSNVNIKASHLLYMYNDIVSRHNDNETNIDEMNSEENAELFIDWDKLIQHGIYCNFYDDRFIINSKIYADLINSNFTINELWEKYISTPFYNTLDDKEKSDAYSKIYDDVTILDTIGVKDIAIKIR